jgi:hypothetical protein
LVLGLVSPTELILFLAFVRPFRIAFLPQFLEVSPSFITAITDYFLCNPGSSVVGLPSPDSFTFSLALVRPLRIAFSSSFLEV